MRRINFLLLFVFVLISLIYSCTASFEGSLCNPDLQNCPEGYYCGSDGTCHRGNPEVRDIYGIDNLNVNDAVVDIYDGTGDIPDSTGDAMTGDDDISSDVLLDSGCVDECKVNTCKDKSVQFVCGDFDNDGCKEKREVACGDNSVCLNGECVCTEPYKDCDSDMSNGCESNTKENPSTCGSCSNNCGNNSRCNEGVCDCIFPFANCNGVWSDGCEIDLSSDGKNCGNCNNECGVNTTCNNFKCECLSGYADCDSNKGCEINLFSPRTCGSSCQNYINCGQRSVCNNGFCACESGYANCVNGWIDGCETDILSDKLNCGECNHRCNPLNVNNALCNNGKCDYDSCKVHYLDKDRDRGNGCEYWSNFPKRYRYMGSDNEIPAVIFKTDGGYILGGDIINKGIWLLKVDENGEIVWQKNIQLYGEVHLRKGIAVYEDNGILGGYVFVGTSKNGNRNDVFIFKVNPDGIFQVSKSYSVPNSVYGLEVNSVLYKKDKDLLVLLGAYERQPMLLFVYTDLSLKRAIYYQSANSPIHGLFRGGIFRGSGDELILTGDVKVEQLQPSFSNVIYMATTNSGEIQDIAYYGNNGKDYSGAYVAEIDSNGLYAIAGSEISQSFSSGMIYLYNYSSKKWDNIVKVNILSETGVIFKSSFTYALKYSSLFDGILFGGDVTIAAGNSDVLFGVLPTSLDSVGVIVSIGSIKNESLLDVMFDNNFMFISPTDSFSSDIDMMVVRLKDNLTIPAAVCEKSFYKSLEGSIEKLVLPNLNKSFPEIFEIDNVVVKDNLSYYGNTSGSALNICIEPVNP